MNGFVTVGILPALRGSGTTPNPDVRETTWISPWAYFDTVPRGESPSDRSKGEKTPNSMSSEVYDKGPVSNLRGRDRERRGWTDIREELPYVPEPGNKKLRKQDAGKLVLPKDPACIAHASFHESGADAGIFVITAWITLVSPAPHPGDYP